MTLSLTFPTPPKHHVLSTLGALSVVRDPTTNNRYLTILSPENDWEEYLEDEPDAPQNEEPVQVISLAGEHPRGSLQELPPDTKVILEPAELKVLSDDDVGLRFGVTNAEMQELRNNRKIQAIKMIRERACIGLKEAKDIADQACARMGI